MWFPLSDLHRFTGAQVGILRSLEILMGRHRQPCSPFASISVGPLSDFPEMVSKRSFELKFWLGIAVPTFFLIFIDSRGLGWRYLRRWNAHPSAQGGFFHPFASISPEVMSVSQVEVVFWEGWGFLVTASREETIERLGPFVPNWYESTLKSHREPP